MNMLIMTVRVIDAQASCATLIQPVQLSHAPRLESSCKEKAAGQAKHQEHNDESKFASGTRKGQSHKLILRQEW